jgi:hypothetical protein
MIAAAATAAALLTCAGSRSDASLIIDLRAIGGTAQITTDGKAFVADPGVTLTVGIFARVSGTNGIHDESVQSVYGSVTSPGPTLLNLSGGGPIAPFNGTGFQNGSIQDIDSDGDLDLGSAGSTATGKFFAHSDAPTPAGVAVNPNTGEVQIGVLSFVITGGGPFGLINFIPRSNVSGGNLNAAALWFEDNDGVTRTPTIGAFAPGAPIIATDYIDNGPEPSSLALLSLCAIGLLSRRRPPS